MRSIGFGRVLADAASVREVATGNRFILKRIGVSAPALVGRLRIGERQQDGTLIGTFKSSKFEVLPAE
jgi:hypothetical protein